MTLAAFITYALTLVALTLVSGRISDTLAGRTRIFTLGFISFILASHLSSFAWNLCYLVIFRALQGVSAAMFQVNNQAIITAIFPPHERGRAFGINSAASFLLMYGLGVTANASWLTARLLPAIWRRF